MTWTWESCDGFCYGEIKMLPADGYWPPMISIELEDFGMTLTVDDAQALADRLLEAIALAAQPTPAGEGRGRWLSAECPQCPL